MWPNTSNRTETRAGAMRHIAACRLPTAWAEFTLHGFQDLHSGQEHVALLLGDVANGAAPLCRLHSECLTGDALLSLRCDCGPQLQAALQDIAAAGRGLLLYLRQEGRGIGLLNKIRAYRLQDAGADTVEANERLGLQADLRSYEAAAAMLDHFGVRAVRLMTNNPAKIEALQDAGVKVLERVSLWRGRNPHNAHYLDTKSRRLGHLPDGGPDIGEAAA